MGNSDHITDSLNAKMSKEIVNNSISLIVFIDEARFYKGLDGKAYAFLAMILNLPSNMRNAFYHTIPILFWQGIKFIDVDIVYFQYNSY